MNLKKIKIKNFYSVKDAEIDFTKFSGVVWIDGKNKDSGGSNGSGKSVILESIVWGLFGKSIRKSTESSMVNVDEGKNCEVEISLDNGVTISRSRRPSSLLVIKDGKTYTQESAFETQKIINSFVGTDYKTFSSAIVFGQHSNSDFLSSTSEEKRNIVKNFLNLDDMFKIREKIRPIKSEHSTTMKISEAVVQTISKDVDKLSGDLEVASKHHVKPELSLEGILEAEDMTQSLKRSENDKTSEWNVAKAKMLDTEYKISLGEYERDSKCRSCGQNTVEKQTKEDLVKLWFELDVHKGSLELLEKELKDIENHIDRIKPEISSKEYSKNIELYNLASRKTEIEKNIEAKKEDIKINEDKWKVARESYDVMRFWEKALSEQGVIKFVIRNVLSYLNESCSKYLALLTNGNIKISFDDELNETITSNGRIIHHCSLSGGEKRRINLAVMLGLQSLLKFTGKQTPNILFFDEITENMDAEGTQGLYILLAELRKENTVFLITHNDNLKTLLENCQTILVEKKKGISKIKASQC